MKRSGFTMVELIFVIVIIGILAVTALPKFKNISSSATVNNFVKMITDSENGSYSAFINEKELNENKQVALSDILKVNGRYWNTDIDNNVTDDNITVYDYNDTVNKINARLTLNSGEDANLTIYIKTANNKVGNGIKDKLNLDDNYEKTIITVFE